MSALVAESLSSETIDAAGEAFAAELRGMSLAALIEIVEAMYAENTIEWERRRGTDAAMDWLVERAGSIDGEAYMRAMRELAARVDHARASLFDALADALDRGDPAAFAEAAALWRWLPTAIRDFIRAANGVEVEGFDPSRDELEVWEFTETARRLREAYPPACRACAASKGGAL